MASTPISANAGAFVSTSDTNLYTSPIGTSTMVSKMTLSNTTGSAVVVNVYLSSSNVVNSTAFLQILTVPANGTVQVANLAQHIIPANGAVLASADTAAAVIAKISAVQFT